MGIRFLVASALQHWDSLIYCDGFCTFVRFHSGRVGRGGMMARLRCAVTYDSENRATMPPLHCVAGRPAAIYNAGSSLGSIDDPYPLFELIL